MNEVLTRYIGRYLSLLEVNTWEYVSRSNASGVVVLVPVTETRKIVLVEQFRPPVGKRVIELPAGLIGDLSDSDESVFEAGNRELAEETGFVAGKLDLLMKCPSSPGMSDEMVSFLLATELTRVGPGGGDHSEDITVHEVPLRQVDEWLENRLAQDQPLDPKIYAALYWLSRR
jgi:ADP-ribose pyrophosphatase